MTDEIQKAIQRYDAAMAQIGGCGDGGCLVETRKGQHTNGGCRCWSDRMKAQRVMAHGKMLANAVRTALESQTTK